MARKLILDGNGLTVSAGGSAIGNITELTLPGWSKPEIDDTALDNTGVTTYILGNLATYTDLTFTVKMGAVADVPTGNVQWVIAPPGVTSGGITFMGQLKEQGTATVRSGEGILIPMTVKITNVNTSGGIVQPTVSGI